MAAAASRAKVRDVTLCPICRDDFDNPRSLPCLHTFCLKCLEKYCEDKYPEDEMPCPVCREEFQIPTKGLVGLRHNFFIQDLLDAKLASLLSQSLRVEASRAATSEGEPQPRGSYCEKHQGKVVELYCLDCRVNACTLCLHYEHQQHKCHDISKAAEMFVGQLDIDIGRVSTRVDAVHKEKKHTEDEQTKFRDWSERAEMAIKEKGEEIKRLVDSQVSELLQEVQSVRSRTLKDAQARVERLELAQVAMESFNAYSLEVKNKGKPSDITRAANELHVRADELLQTYVTSDDYRAPYVEFSPADLWSATECGSNMVGSITTKTIPVSRALQTLPEGETVGGVAVLGDNVYVLREKAEDGVEVYDVNSYSLKSCLSVPGARSFADMTSCGRHQCLYISDDVVKCIHRLELNGKITQWPVGDEPDGLSMTVDCNVLVTCNEVRKLKLFNAPRGDIMKEISLQPDVVNPNHAIQLATGQYVVCHGRRSNPYHRVCLIDAGGKTVTTYGSKRGSAAGQMKVPLRLAVDCDGFIFVVDARNKRVLQLSPNLAWVCDVVSRGQGFKWWPERLCLDVNRRRLYVAENEYKDGEDTAGRVVVFSV